MVSLQALLASLFELPWGSRLGMLTGELGFPLRTDRSHACDHWVTEKLQDPGVALPMKERPSILLPQAPERAHLCETSSWSLEYFRATSGASVGAKRVQDWKRTNYP